MAVASAGLRAALGVHRQVGEGRMAGAAMGSLASGASIAAPGGSGGMGPSRASVAARARAPGVWGALGAGRRGPSVAGLVGARGLRGMPRVVPVPVQRVHAAGTAGVPFGGARHGARRGAASTVPAPRAVAGSGEMAATATPEHPAFELVRHEFVAEYGSYAALYRHKGTGAELMSLATEDENKTFGVVLRTPVEDSTGVPHILEHSVLCGSRKYPIKEPFVELMKGSLNTFLNAFTYPDRTCYPVASCNLQDFYNLVDVYLDAVYHPKCIEDRQVFEQEGWHYELNDPSDQLTFKGVVFNEMKGVYSSPDSVLGRDSQQTIFPDNNYGVDSGGDPAVIPDLTFEQFREFHAKYYHPSNSRLWFYGDDPVAKRLEIADSYLSQFERREDIKDVGVRTQKLFTAPKRVTLPYAVGKDTPAEELANKHYMTVNWMLAEEPLDLETELALGFLNHLMLGTVASPLQRALDESGLGEASVGGGLEDELKQITFSVGLKGVNKDNCAAVEELILGVFKDMRENGFPAESVEASMNTIEFSLRENNTGRFPRGLSLMLRSMAYWLYDRDPFQPLRWVEPLARLKTRLESGEDVFGPLIQRFFIDNTHRVTLEMAPDTMLGDALEEKERARLAAKQASMSQDELAAMVEATRSLKEKQETPDSPEALACVPSLDLGDIPKKISHIPCDVTERAGSTWLTHDIFTNDVLYADIAFDLRSVPEELLPLVPFFNRCVNEFGTEKHDFEALQQVMGAKTGGVGVSSSVGSLRGADGKGMGMHAHLMMRGKCLTPQAPDMFQLMGDMLLTTNFDDQERFAQAVAETKAMKESRFVSGGHGVAACRLNAMRSTAGWVDEQMGGVESYAYVKALQKRVQEDWDGVLRDLHRIRDSILARKGSLVNLTTDAKSLDLVGGSVDEFLSRLPADIEKAAAWTKTLGRRNEALVVPTQVNYVGKAGNLYRDAGYDLHGSAYVINKHLGTTWLWDRVRVSGGAYGGFSDFDPHSGQFTYLSYRDPNLQGTIDNYDGTGEFLRGLKVDKDTLSKAIIGTIGDIDSYQLPDAKGYTSMVRYMLGTSDEERQERRDQILGTTEADFHRFADALDAVRESGNVVAVCSADAAAKANAKGNDFLHVSNIL